MERKGNDKLKNRRKGTLFQKSYNALLLACLTFVIILGSKVYDLQNKLTVLTEEHVTTVANYEERIESYENTIDMQNSLIVDFSYTIQKQDDALLELSEVNHNYVDELNELRSRSELYDKYEYVLVNSQGRTDVTYAQIRLGQDLMASKGYDPDLLFGTIFVESRGVESAKNANSTASGYGQFLSSTGKWIYEDYLGLGTYDPNTTPFDGDNNIKMMVGYYEYLYNRTGGSTLDMVAAYSGGGKEYASTYLSKVERIVNSVGSTIYDGK